MNERSGSSKSIEERLAIRGATTSVSFDVPAERSWTADQAERSLIEIPLPIGTVSAGRSACLVGTAHFYDPAETPQ